MNRDRWLSLISPIVLLALWELAVALGWLNRVFYPPPSEVFVTLAHLETSGDLGRDVGEGDQHEPAEVQEGMRDL